MLSIAGRQRDLAVVILRGEAGRVGRNREADGSPWTAGSVRRSRFEPAAAGEGFHGDIVGDRVGGAQRDDGLRRQRARALGSAEGQAGLRCDQTLRDRRVQFRGSEVFRTSDGSAGYQNPPIQQQRGGVLPASGTHAVGSREETRGRTVEFGGGCDAAL